MGRGWCYAKSRAEVAAVQCWSAPGTHGNNWIHGGKTRYDTGSLWEGTAHFKLFSESWVLNKLFYFWVSIHTSTCKRSLTYVFSPPTYPPPATADLYLILHTFFLLASNYLWCDTHSMSFFVNTLIYIQVPQHAAVFLANWVTASSSTRASLSSS